MPSLVDAARLNLSVDNESVALFEIARVYLPEERRHVAGIVDGGIADAKWAVEQVYAAVKLEPSFEQATLPLLHPGKAARTAEGWLGELHPQQLEGTWGAFELDLDALAATAPGAVRAAEVSAFPELRQDLAFAVGEDVPAAALALLEPTPLFDPSRLRTRAHRTGGGFRLEGAKSLVPLVTVNSISFSNGVVAGRSVSGSSLTCSIVWRRRTVRSAPTTGKTNCCRS